LPGKPCLESGRVAVEPPVA